MFCTVDKAVRRDLKLQRRKGKVRQVQRPLMDALVVKRVSERGDTHENDDAMTDLKTAHAMLDADLSPSLGWIERQLPGNVDK